MFTVFSVLGGQRVDSIVKNMANRRNQKRSTNRQLVKGTSMNCQDSLLATASVSSPSVCEKEEEEEPLTESLTIKEIQKDGCQKCGKDDHHNLLLLCECCNDEYHTYCLDPPLDRVPDGDFVCGKFFSLEISYGM
jgi:hypothetical protein